MDSRSLGKHCRSTQRRKVKEAVRLSDHILHTIALSGMYSNESITAALRLLDHPGHLSDAEQTFLDAARNLLMEKQ